MTRGCPLSSSDPGRGKGGGSSTQSSLTQSGFCFLSPGIAETGHCGPHTAAFNTQHLAPPSKGSIPTFQEQTGVAVHGSSQVWEGGVHGPGKGRGRVGLWGSLFQAKPHHLKQSLETVVEGRWGPRMHTVPSVPATQCTSGQQGRQPGPSHASTIWEPLPGLKGQLKKLDPVPGHSQALFLSQGGMRDSPCSEWRPLVRWGRREQSSHCTPEGSPHGSRL